ncbi:uncharacterized protein LOC111305511 isoform X5 [Durio zibethinus]|uniref:Uncharacterized protein LOC111305511 isoform X5 n=1 Tax=Durio zibethinus TaxID=66656 RepID=A0A6P6A1H8_DURZI|nr:uncharacterized protein LOC111305511 isoform X5 [Durio zibethinus]
MNLKNLKDLSLGNCLENSNSVSKATDELWEYNGLRDAHQGECEGILLEMQQIFYQYLRTESAVKEPEEWIETWEDEEDEYLARAVYEHLQLNDEQVNLDMLRDRLAEAHADHFDRGCRLKPKFCQETRFGLAALYILCQDCSTFEVVI